MSEAHLPEVAAGRLDRHAKLFAFAFAALGGAVLLGHLLDGGLALAELRDALAAVAALPLLVWERASTGRRLLALGALLLLWSQVVPGAQDGLTHDFAAPAGLAWLLWSALGLGLALVVGVPLWYFARHLGHPAAAVRRWAEAGVLALAIAVGAVVVLTEPALGWRTPLYALASAVAFVGLRRAHARWCSAAPARGVTLSVAVICKDEADRIGRLLEAVKGWADEIVVLDSGSNDGTVEVARRYTERVEVTDWPGYGAQKQRALERCTGEWVLSLDADEVPSAAFKREVDAWLAARTGHDGFKAHWVSVVFGGPIDFGADGRYHTRLLRRVATRFDGATVHEEALVAGRVATLESPVFHFTFRDHAHMERKFDEYAWLSARARFAQGRRATRFGALVRGGISFLLLYLVRLGLLDGWRGLRMAARYARYTHDKYAFLSALARGGAG